MPFVLRLDFALVPARNVPPLLCSRIPAIRLRRRLLKTCRAKPPILFRLPAHELLCLVNAQHSGHWPVRLEVLEVDRHSCDAAAKDANGKSFWHNTVMMLCDDAEEGHAGNSHQDKPL